MKESNKYILYVGNDYPHKNLKNLILAHKQLGLDYDLILNTEFVDDEKLKKLYENASVFVFPSLVEGFGLPPLEAMICGVPVVCSDIEVFHEVLRNAVLYFNPFNPSDMAEKIKTVLLDKELRKKLIQKGFERVKKYKWKLMAEKTLEVYKKIPA